MKRLRSITLMMVCLVALCVYGWDLNEKYEGPKEETRDLSWHADILKGYEARYVNQGEAFDGPCRSTIVRKLGDVAGHKGVLYVHGFNDYFFQREMGEEFADSGFHFYAVDLRRYGRSREPWQYPFNVRKLDEYFDDIDSALMQMRRDGVRDITLSGHSTGGLTVLLYAAKRGARVGVNRVVTDSPFLEWNYNAMYRDLLIPMVSFVGSMAKNMKIPQGHCDGYAYSLLKEYHGQWEYDTDWKMIYSPPVTASWVRAINKGQSELMNRKSHIVVPILVMHSSRKVEGCSWTEEFQTGDAVLDPAMIQKRGEQLGKNRVVAKIDSGLHDLILSEPAPRREAYRTIFEFIRTH